MKIKYTNLHCGSCATELESQLAKDVNIQNVQVDFVNEIINLETSYTKEEVARVIKSQNDEIIIEDNITYTYNISGLDCRGCAIELENHLKDQSYINNVVVDFATSKIVVEYDKNNFNKLVSDIELFDNKIKVDVMIKNEKYDFTSLYGVFIAIIIVFISFIIEMDDNFKLVLLSLAFVIAAYDILIKLVKNLFKLKLLDENFLMGLASLSAFIINEHFEAIAIIVFYKIGEFIQGLAVNNSRESIKSLVDIQASYANLVKNNQIEKVDPKNLEINDIILVKVGEKVPIDGVVIENETYLDTKAITGETKLSRVKINDLVYSGTINMNSAIKIKVTKKYEDSTVSKILDLVEKSSLNKAKTDDFITKFAKIYTPSIVLIAVVIALIPPLILKQNFDQWIYRGLIFLVVSCPCALVISIPLGFFGGIGNAAKHGILIKGANYLEALANLDTIVYDKTGTLTKANFKVLSINTLVNENDFIEKLQYGEYFSNHPIKKAISEYSAIVVDINRLQNFQEISGKGIKVYLDKKILLIGNDALMHDYNIVGVTNRKSGTIVNVAYDNQYLGYAIIGDELKLNSKNTITKLRKIGIRQQIMLSGDSSRIVNEIKNELALDQSYGELLPQDKVSKFNKIKSDMKNNGNIAFIGDGVNDAPVLKTADIGIAMGGIGSDAAIEAADIVIMDDDIIKVYNAIIIAKKTKRIVYQNIFFALSIKLLVLVLGTFGLAQIWEAVIADVGVAILAILNVLRVLNNKEIS